VSFSCEASARKTPNHRLRPASHIESARHSDDLRGKRRRRARIRGDTAESAARTREASSRCRTVIHLCVSCDAHFFGLSLQNVENGCFLGECSRDFGSALTPDGSPLPRAVYAAQSRCKSRCKSLRQPFLHAPRACQTPTCLIVGQPLRAMLTARMR
jgi:hypothetical protein